MPVSLSRMRRGTQIIGNVLGSFLHHPLLFLRLLSAIPFLVRGVSYGRSWVAATEKETLSSCLDKAGSAGSVNPLRVHFDSHREGRGVWKFLHYFDIYHRHLSKFAGREVHVLEIGVYSGGSLQMWQECFGQQCHVYGVDIERACKVYEDDRTKIFVGDQGDRGFWKRFKEENPAIDILIDDGSHDPEHQIVTLEEMLPHLRPGGIYLCEDVVGKWNRFHSYVHGLATDLNSFESVTSDQRKGLACIPTQLQAAIQSIHFYPFVTVIEKSDHLRREFTAPKHGTEWQPFL